MTFLRFRSLSGRFFIFEIDKSISGKKISIPVSGYAYYTYSKTADVFYISSLRSILVKLAEFVRNTARIDEVRPFYGGLGWTKENVAKQVGIYSDSYCEIDFICLRKRFNLYIANRPKKHRLKHNIM